MWAGPVSFEIINFALLIKETKIKIFTALFSLSITIFAFKFLASKISPGPGAIRISYFLKIFFSFILSSLKYGHFFFLMFF